MIKNIVFDIGKVLVRFDWEDYLASFGFPEEEYQAIANAMFLSPDWELVDEGRLSYGEIEAIFQASAPGYVKDIARVFSTFGDCISRFDYTRDWIRSLKKEGLSLYYLSNYGDFTREYTKAELDFCELMDGGLMSYQVQLLKPNPAFYQCLFQKYDLKPEECIFIDDNAANIETARFLGMHTIRFQDYESAIRELSRIRCQEASVH